MSLIYNALNKLEKKLENGTPNPIGSVSADQYVLVTKPAGMPGWVKFLLALCVLGVVAGWLAMTVLRDQIQALKQGLDASSVAAKKSDSTPAPKQPQEMAVPNGNADTSPTANVDKNLEQDLKAMLNAAANENVKTEGKSDPTSPELKPAAIGAQIAKIQQEAVANVAAAAAANEQETQVVPEREISHVEIRVETPNSSNSMQGTKARAEKSSASKVAKLEKNAKPAAAPSAEELNSQDVARLTLAIKSAIQVGKKTEADELIAQLQTKLDPESLTLLHLKAWRQMQGGDQQQAIHWYQQIVGRNPEDEIAAVNLSLLYWRAGQKNEARKVIVDIAERKPDSEIVQTYSRQFGVQK
ncbi:tetratricopeptide repeat protein [Undibacterium fentianense]|uniref:Tetratricopeptide repeat protein n=1 Tax=Undibacterium fentianense TaxID=2828728 RepID=A0A941E1W9_9BURK|nr:tetratricopeptide repeat protein [Undibacterium fentianense]MBR7800855.1 tetratricopeptide repeat protein [Undibacterium fentianense]